MVGDSVLTLHLGNHSHQCATVLWSIRHSSNDMGAYSLCCPDQEQPKCVIVDSSSSFKNEVEEGYYRTHENILLSSWDGEVQRVERDR